MYVVETVTAVLTVRVDPQSLLRGSRIPCLPVPRMFCGVSVACEYLIREKLDLARELPMTFCVRLRLEARCFLTNGSSCCGLFEKSRNTNGLFS